MDRKALVLRVGDCLTLQCLQGLCKSELAVYCFAKQILHLTINIALERTPLVASIDLLWRLP